MQPSESWHAANLTLAYLAAFAGAIALVHIAPARWSGVLGGVVLAAVVLCGWSLLVKAFPSISSLDLYARLRAPFDYWNAVGLMAALGIPGCLWLGARRDGHAALSALAVPALGLLLVALLLSYGRGPLLAAVVSRRLLVRDRPAAAARGRRCWRRPAPARPSCAHGRSRTTR